MEVPSSDLILVDPCPAAAAAVVGACVIEESFVVVVAAVVEIVGPGSALVKVGG